MTSTEIPAGIGLGGNTEARYETGTSVPVQERECVGARSGTSSVDPRCGEAQTFLFLGGLGRACAAITDRSETTANDSGLATYTAAFSSLLSAVFDELSAVVRKLTTAVASVVSGSGPQVNPPASPPGGASSGGTGGASAITPSLSFSEKLKLELRPGEGNRVSEAELQRGVVVFQLYQRSPALAARFGEAFDDTSKSEDTRLRTEKALIAIVEDGGLSRTDANWVLTVSHRAAQLDSKEDELSESEEGPGGFDLFGAIRCAEATLAGIQSGAVRPKGRTL